MSKHPGWGELMERPLDPEVAFHVQECPQCRVDRRRLLVEVPSRDSLSASVLARFTAARDRIARELLPAVRTAMARLPRYGRPDRLPHASTAFGPYRAVGVLGRGETSLVLLGVHERHGTRHALKIVRTRDPEVLRQVAREHRMLDELDHPLLLPVLDSVDAPVGQAVLVLEFVDGPSLARLLRNRAFLPWPWIDAIAIDVLLSVEALHEAGWVHRDLNPGNVLLDPHPRFRARVGDFGQVAERGTVDPERRVGPMPLYAAPEQLVPGRPADTRADVFSLGSLLYELVTHQRCFAGVDADDVARRVREVEHIPVGDLRPDTPARIVQAIEAALTADLEARPARAAELLDLWTRGAGEASRPLIDLTGAERAALRSMRDIERLPEARSVLTPTTVPEPTGQVRALTQSQLDQQAYRRPTLPPFLREGRWAMIVGAVGLVAIIALATNSALQPAPEPPPTEIRLDRGRPGVVDPYLSRNRRTLVFSDQQDLWVGPIDGSTPWTLTGTFAPAATQPTWSWDQAAVAFTGPDGIYTVDLRQSASPMPAVPWARDPTWSPDGSRIVFVARAHDDQPEALRVWDRWTQEVVTLFEEPGLARPTFSPSGSRIALETGAGLGLVDVVIDAEGRLAVTGRSTVAAGDTEPRWLDDRSLAVWRAAGGQPGGAVVRWDEVDGVWRDRVLLETAHDVRTVEVGTDERWFVLGLSDPVPTVLRIDRGADETAAPTVVAEGRGAWVAADDSLAMVGPDGAIQRMDGADVTSRYTGARGGHWGVDPGGAIVVRDDEGWSVGLEGARRPYAELDGLPLDGPFTWSADGRWFAAQHDGAPIVIDLAEPVEPQIETAVDAPWPGDGVAGLSPDGSWLLVVAGDGFVVVDRLSGEVVGEPVPGLAATFADDETLAVLGRDEVRFVERGTGRVVERHPLHPHRVAADAGIAASSRTVFVDGIVERGGLLRVDRLSGGR